ncbi:MASY synthase, partial [Polypterus senegalus]
MIPGVELEDPPRDLKFEHQTLFTTDCIQFLAELITTFDCKVEKVLLQRAATKIHLDVSGDLPEFSSLTSHIRDDKEWKILPVPERLQNRHVDVGDLAPCDTERFLKALKSDAQGIQVQGKEVPGALFDYGLLVYHNGKLLFENKSGPFFYLSKIESHHEARLWNDIFAWTEEKLGLRRGSIKATVLIENVLATFEMDEILLKLLEIKAGIDGFLVYDLELIKPLQELFLQHTNGKNQLDVLREDVSVTRTELLTMPSVWQWVRHQVTLEDDSRMVTRGLIRDLVEEGIRVKLVDFLQSNTTKDKERLNTAISIFLEVVQKRDFPEFITTYLNLEHTFLASTAE